MSAVPMQADPGPLARLREVVASEDTMSVIVQRITDADRPETLKDIARAWRVPLGRLAEWITEDRERAEKYSTALRIAAEQVALETVAIADGASPEDVAVRKLRVDTRFRLASKLARQTFGEMNEVHHTGSVSLIAVLSGIPRSPVGSHAEIVDAEVLPAHEKYVPEKNSEKILEKEQLI